jgi:hypothetical protein
MTFDAYAAAYIDAHKVGWKNAKHRDQWSNTLNTYSSPVFGSLPVQVVDVGLVMKVLEPIRHAKSETASRLRGRIEAVLDWATVRGYRKGVGAVISTSCFRHAARFRGWSIIPRWPMTRSPISSGCCVAKKGSRRGRWSS